MKNGCPPCKNANQRFTMLVTTPITGLAMNRHRYEKRCRPLCRRRPQIQETALIRRFPAIYLTSIWSILSICEWNSSGAAVVVMYAQAIQPQGIISTWIRQHRPIAYPADWGG